MIATQTQPRNERLLDAFRATRAETLLTVDGLEPEDFVLQSMPSASPLSWHLAHTTWFFEEFVLGPADPSYRPFDSRFQFLFNSYYEAVGDRIARADRGLLSRPTVASIREYRAHVDQEVAARLAGDRFDDAALDALRLGLHHEQQHQELMVTDLLHAFSRNPLEPAMRADPSAGKQGDRSSSGETATPAPLRFLEIPGGTYDVGAPADGSFRYDNEEPRHRALIHDCEIASRTVTCREWIAFIQAGGYRTSSLWLSKGWDRIRSTEDPWEHPLYWRRDEDATESRGWTQLTSFGRRPVDLDAPVTHVSFYEADAFARWSGARLPTEFEWEVANALHPGPDGALRESRAWRPRRVDGETGLLGMAGNVWEWTASPYVGYPGYAAAPGALGEYNGKFMLDQMVLRGGSCVTPATHLRATYRNFFPADARWQFSGLRLAR